MAAASYAVDGETLEKCILALGSFIYSNSSPCAQQVFILP